MDIDLTRLEIAANKDVLRMPEVMILPYQNKNIKERVGLSALIVLYAY